MKSMAPENKGETKMKTLKTMILSAGAAMILRTALLAASLVASAAGQTLIGIDYVSATSQDEIRTVNPNTGETTLLNSFKFDSGYWVSGTVVANRAAGKLYVESSTRRCTPSAWRAVRFCQRSLSTRPWTCLL